MLKSCPSCAYIGNDGEHVCPFCKADLAVGRPRRSSGTALRSFGAGARAGARIAPEALRACYYRHDRHGLPTAGPALAGQFDRN